MNDTFSRLKRTATTEWERDVVDFVRALIAERDEAESALRTSTSAQRTMREEVIRLRKALEIMGESDDKMRSLNEQLGAENKRLRAEVARMIDELHEVFRG